MTSLYEYTTDNWKDDLRKENNFYSSMAEEEEKKERDEDVVVVKNIAVAATPTPKDLDTVTTPETTTSHSMSAQLSEESMSSLSVSAEDCVVSSPTAAVVDVDLADEIVIDDAETADLDEQIANYRIRMLDLRTEGRKKRSLYQQEESRLQIQLDDLKSKWDDKQLHVHACNLEDVVLERFQQEMEDTVRWLERIVKNQKEEGQFLESQLRYDIDALAHRMIETSEQVAWLENDVMQIEMKFKRQLKQQQRVREKYQEEEEEQKRLIQQQLEELYRLEREQLEQNTTKKLEQTRN